MNEGAPQPLLKRPAGLGDEVYGLLLAQLMSLAIAPGARITVDNLARVLGVSQTPIREALGRLEAEGLVVKQHLIGYRAAPQMSRQRFEDLYELRLLLEPHAAARAAVLISPEELTDLDRLSAAMTRIPATDPKASYSAFAGLDDAFHATIAKAAANELVREALTRLHTHAHLFRLMFNSRVTQEALGEHAAVTDALRAGDAQAAEAAMRRHIERSRTRFLSIFTA